MSWADPRTDLRHFLSDSDRDNLVKEQKVFGPTSGQNRRFFTFHDRLVTSGYQSAASRPLRVWIRQPNGTPEEIAASGINVTDPYRGEFEMMLVPSGSVTLTASYYFQQHLDEELDGYLLRAAKQVNAATIGDTPTELQESALHFAASFAHSRLSQRWFMRKSDQFQTNEVPSEEATARIQHHRETATYLKQQALDFRKSYYDLRNDRGRQPAYGLLSRTPRPWGPNR